MGNKKLFASSLRYEYNATSNGIIVIDSSRIENREALPVALINEHRSVTFFKSPLSPMQKDSINHYASTSEPVIALSQQKFFLTRPVKACVKARV